MLLSSAPSALASSMPWRSATRAPSEPSYATSTRLNILGLRPRDAPSPFELDRIDRAQVTGHEERIRDERGDHRAPDHGRHEVRVLARVDDPVAQAEQRLREPRRPLLHADDVQQAESERAQAPDERMILPDAAGKEHPDQAGR